MIDELRSLDDDQLRRLLGLLTNDVEVLTAHGPRVKQLLVEVLRENLSVPEKADLGEYLRRRLVEVVRDDFAFLADTDLLTDTELAFALTDYVLSAAAQLDGTDEEGPFATYFRTKSARQRASWVASASELAEASIDDPELSGHLYRESAEEPGPAPAARAVLTNLGLVGGAAAIRRTGVSNRTDFPGSTAAAPLAAAGAALFLAGVGGATFVVLGDLADRARRARRARRSTLVQTVITLSAFVLAESSQVNVDEDWLTTFANGDGPTKFKGSD